MWKKVISEVILATMIILIVMGVPTKTTKITEKVKAKDTECNCGKPDSFSDMDSRYGINAREADIVYDEYYDNKTVLVTEVKHVVSYWSDRILVLAAYFLLIGLISALVSSISTDYWYFILPMTETILFFVYFPKNHKQKKINLMTTTNETVVTNLSNVLNKLNRHLNRR